MRVVVDKMPKSGDQCLFSDVINSSILQCYCHLAHGQCKYKNGSCEYLVKAKENPVVYIETKTTHDKHLLK